MKLRPLQLVRKLDPADEAFLARGPVYLFDGVCVLCSRAVMHMLKHQKPGETPIRFVAIQSAIGRRLAEAYDNPPDDPYTFLFFENGEVFELVEAIMAMASHAKGAAGLAPLLHAIPRPLRNFFYLRVARNRYRVFGQLKSCYLPDASTRDRFVLPGDDAI
jgi:predicted DCC family thiol-disulfide oxidoreductase YuxK